MDSSEKNQVKVKINAELSDLEKNIEDLKQATQPISPDNAIGRITRMDAINNKAVNDVALVNAENRRHRLHKVLSDIELPEFGTCIRCKKPIPLMRLLHIPETRVCVNCGR